MKTRIAIGAALILLAGCATPPPPRQSIRTTMIYDAPKNTVWPMIVAAVSQYPVKVIEKDSGLVVTDFVSLPAGVNNMEMKRWVYPPGGFLATWNGLRMSMNVLVTEPSPGKSQVNVRTHFEAFEHNVQKTWIVCQSNGVIEESILAQVAAPHQPFVPALR